MCSIIVMFIALLRQNNSAWEAYFIVTDDQPFDAELRATLSAYGDARLHFLDIVKEFRPKVDYKSIALCSYAYFLCYTILLLLYLILYYTTIVLLLQLLQYNPIDAGYPASDEAMRIVAKLPQCAWISVTNGDNAYGSAVVDKVLSLIAEVKPSPELVLMPMDSRNFDNLGTYT